MAGSVSDFDFHDGEDNAGTAEASDEEDTEDASETETAKKEPDFTEIKEQMYQDKLAQLKMQLQQLKDGTLPDYVKKLKKLDQQYQERLRVVEVWYECELDCVENDFVKEKEASVKEFEEKKEMLKENLIAEMEDKKKQIESDRHLMELMSDTTEVKPVITRKLRRRPNDPAPLPDKRRKASPAQMNFCLTDDEIMEDLRIINKISGKPVMKKPLSTSLQLPPSVVPEIIYEARIDDGKLYFDRRWFHRGQPIIVESRDGKLNAVVKAVGTQEVWFRMYDDKKLRVSISQLQSGEYFIRRR